jgi:regulator of sigma E protease
MSILLLIIGLILFICLVIAHEFGHFIMARRNGIEVEEFGIGFPPRAMVITERKRTVYSLNWLPLGGFCKMKGEHDSDTQKGSFGAASLGAKTKVLLAGVTMNLITAFLLFTILALVGMPQLLDNQFTVKSDTVVSRQEVLVGLVESNSPASKAGLQPRDQLLAIGPAGQQQAITSQDQLPGLTQRYAGQTIQMNYKHNNQFRQATVHLRSDADVQASLKTSHPKGHLGISPTQYSLTRSTWSAPVVAVGLIKQITVATMQGLGHAISSLFHGQGSQASAQVAGPVGIFVLLKDGSSLGYQFMLAIIAIISLTLALMNILPIPALDGGRLFLLLISRAVRRPLTPKTEELVNGLGMALLMLLFVVITVVDVKRNF